MIFPAKAYTGYFGIFNMVSHWRLRNMKLTSILVIFRVIFVNRVISAYFGHFWPFRVISSLEITLKIMSSPKITHKTGSSIKTMFKTDCSPRIS
jgi:hypothetical protein